MDKSFNAYIENSIRDNWELTALSDFKGVSYSYKDIGPQNRKDAYPDGGGRHKKRR